MRTEPAPLGHKADAAKLPYDLVPWVALKQVVRVLDFGAKKYGAGNWAHVPDARRRYFSATMRHLVSWYLGEDVDGESGLPHLAHAVASILFLLAGPST